jgi:hypothetical protein
LFGSEKQSIALSISRFNSSIVLPADLNGWLLIRDTDESLLTGDEGGEMPFSSCIGAGRPHEEVKLKLQPPRIASVWYLSCGRLAMISFLEAGGCDTVFPDEDRLEEADVATSLLYEFEAIVVFLGGVDNAVDGAVEPEIFLLSCRRCVRGDWNEPFMALWTRGVSTGLRKSAVVGSAQHAVTL